MIEKNIDWNKIKIIFNECTGCIEAIVVPGPGKICGVFGRDTEYIIPFKCICQIGDDIVLVNVCVEEVLKKCKY